MSMLEEVILKMIVVTWRICKWFFLQIFLMYLMPYLWNNHFDGKTICLILFYTALYAIYWETIPKDKRWHWLSLPFFVYSSIAILFCGLIKTWNVSVWYSFLLPLYGAMCVILIKICRKQLRRIHNKYRFGRMTTYIAVLLFFIVLKSISVSWECSKRNSFEKEDILERKDYLLDKLLVNPQAVLNEMPTLIGTQFQGEWALYSCSMLSAALVNISQLYPETKEENIQYIDSLINLSLIHI